MRSRAVWAALLTLATLASALLWNYYPPLFPDQQFTVILAPAPPGTSEPLVVTGQPGRGDFLFLRRLDDSRIVIGYDKWGVGGPVSKPLSGLPGQRHTLEVHHPSLASVVGNPFPAAASRLVVRWDGVVAIDQEVEPPERRPTHLNFARNPIGGSACGPALNGEFLRGDRSWKGDVKSVLTRTERLIGWLTYGIWQVAVVLGCGVLAAALMGKRRVPRAAPDGSWWRQQRLAFWVPAGCGVLVFAGWATFWSGELLATDSFGSFYDFQAVRLLGGRLDVPDEAVSGEAFLHGGKRYGYFGITPALLRVPAAALGIGSGQLTRLSMLAAYVIALLATHALLLEIERWRGRRLSGWIVSLFALNLSLGSTLVFLSSRAYVYHEAIIWGVSFALWALWAAFKYLARPESRWWLASLACGVASVHARPPTGLFALTALGVVSALHFFRNETGNRRRAIGVALASLAGVLSFNGLSYLKFGTWEGCPLRMNVQYDAKRLARIEGKQFHASNIGFTLDVYFLNSNLAWRENFPWVFFARLDSTIAKHPEAKLDLPDATGGIPHVMTGLFLIAVAGVMGAVGAHSTLRPVVLVTAASGVPMVLAMLAAIATAHRYTADFLPWLIGLGVAGVAVTDQIGTRWRTLIRPLLLVATVWAILATQALLLQFQGHDVWGVPESVRVRFRALQIQVDTWTGVKAEQSWRKDR